MIRRILVLFATSAALVAHSDVSSIAAQDQPGAQDVDRIMALSVAATQRHWRARLHSTYIERDESRRRDPAGRVTLETVEISRTILVNGIPFEQLVERNGQPPSAVEDRRQHEELDKLKREAPVRRAERLRQQEEDHLSLIRDVPKAFDFRLVGEEVINGRPAYVLQVTPHPGYQALGAYDRMFSKVDGKLWVDRQDFAWVKADARVIQSFSIGLFIVRLLHGSQVTMEQTRVDDGIWMPARVEVRAAARVFFLRSLAIDRVLTYSEYGLADGSAPVSRNP